MDWHPLSISRRSWWWKSETSWGRRLQKYGCMSHVGRQLSRPLTHSSWHRNERCHPAPGPVGSLSLSGSLALEKITVEYTGHTWDVHSCRSTFQLWLLLLFTALTLHCRLGKGQTPKMQLFLRIIIFLYSANSCCLLTVSMESSKAKIGRLTVSSLCFYIFLMHIDRVHWQ